MLHLLQPTRITEMTTPPPEHARHGKLRNGDSVAFFPCEECLDGFTLAGYRTNVIGYGMETWRKDGSWSYDGVQSRFDLLMNTTSK